MDRQAYLVVSDLHISGGSKTNRYDYNKELYLVFHKIIDLIEFYRTKGLQVSICFLGDIFDRGYKSPQKFGIDASFFFKLKQLVNKMYVCVGNHELNFYNTPFWTLVSEIQSNRINSLPTNVQPIGFENVFDVMDILEFEQVVFHFNHYGCIDSKPIANKTNIAFYHKPIYGEIMIKDAEKRGIDLEYARKMKVVPIERVQGYDVSFLGHMHWLYSTWKLEGSEIYGLASLGRPNKTEVDNTFLERNIPAILIENGKFVEVQENKFQLLSREESVIPEVDVEEKVKYEILKAREEAKSYITTTDDPIQNIQTYIAGQGQISQIFDALINKTFTDTELINRILDLERRARS